MSNASKLGTALITGASAGIGAAYAGRLARRGYDLILVARSKPNLEQLAKGLAAETGVRIQVLPADLTVEADLNRVERVLRDDPNISLLVNNAGAATLRPFASADIGRLDREIQLNIVAPTRLATSSPPGRSPPPHTIRSRRPRILRRRNLPQRRRKKRSRGIRATTRFCMRTQTGR